MMAIPPQTRIGHVHLTVADLERALRFYRDALGFDVTTWYGRDAVFLSAGGYHHHIGLNTWAGRGAPPPPAGTTGLYHFAVFYPDRPALAAALHHQAVAHLHRLHRLRRALLPPRDQVGQVGELVGRDGEHRGRLHQVGGDGLIVGVRLRVVRVAVAALQLVEVERRHAVRQKRQ